MLFQGTSEGTNRICLSSLTWVSSEKEPTYLGLTCSVVVALRGVLCGGCCWDCVLFRILWGHVLLVNTWNLKRKVPILINWFQNETLSLLLTKKYPWCLKYNFTHKIIINHYWIYSFLKFIRFIRRVYNLWDWHYITHVMRWL